MRKRGSGTIITRADGKHRALFPFNADGTREEIENSPFETYGEAEDALDGILESIRAKGITRGGKTVTQLGNEMIDQRELDGYRATASERNRWKAYVVGTTLGDMPFRLVVRGDVRRWLAELRGSGRRKKRVAGKTVLLPRAATGPRLATQTKRNALNLLRAALQSAVDDDLLDENPADAVKVKHHGTTKETSTWLTLAEVSRLLLHATDPAVMLAIATGLRSGELRALRWEDVGDDEITVRFGKPGKPAKNGKIRKVPLLPLARMALDSLPVTNALVLPSITGEHRTAGRIVPPDAWRAWTRATMLGRRVRWHDLRHTCATLLLTGATGEPWSLEAVKEFLGHSSVRVTERYARATGTLAERAAKSVTQEIQKGSTRTAADRARALEIMRRREWDSNPRMTVLQFQRNHNERADVGALWILAGSVVRAVAEGSPFIADRALDLAEAVQSAEQHRAVTA